MMKKQGCSPTVLDWERNGWPKAGHHTEAQRVQKPIPTPSLLLPEARAPRGAAHGLRSTNPIRGQLRKHRF